jgi:peroxidase
MRQALGLRPAMTFAQVNPHPAVVANLTAAYPSTADMDLWIVGLAEKDRHGFMLGETLHRIMVDQFRRTRDGDRFWYLNQFSKELIKMIDQQSLATIIRRNTNIKAELPNNVWIVRRPPPAPRKAR